MMQPPVSERRVNLSKRRSLVRNTRNTRKPRIHELLQMHRGPMRSLFACLEARGRQSRVVPSVSGTQTFFWETELIESWREDWACPQGWTTLRRQRIKKDDLIEAFTLWGSVNRSISTGRKRATMAVSSMSDSIDFGKFEDCFVDWAGDDLEVTLTKVAAACCKYLKRSCLSKLQLRAPWWLLGRGEASSTGLIGPEEAELDAILLTCFQELGIFEESWQVEDFYALCRDTGIFGEVLSPAALLSAFQDSKERDHMQRFKHTINNLAILWWRGEHGDRLGSQESPIACFLVEKILPLIACRGILVIEKMKNRLKVDAECLQVVKEHDMALRCLFVAYSDEAHMPPLSLLHFARDFRLLAADRFAPSAVADAAKLAQHPNHINSDEARGLRWPEFVETLLRLAQKLSIEIDESSLAIAFTNLLTQMDPDGRVFFVGQKITELSPIESHTPPLVRRALAPKNAEFHQQSPPSTNSSTSFVQDKEAARREKTRLDLTERTLSEAAEATRKLADVMPDTELQVIADAVAATAKKIPIRALDQNSLLQDDNKSCFTEEKMTPTTDTGIQVDLLFSDSEWPPPPKKTPHDIWADVTSPIPASPEEDKDMEYNVSNKSLHLYPVAIQRHVRGFILRLRLARLRDKLLKAATQKKHHQQQGKKSQQQVLEEKISPVSQDVLAATKAAQLRANATIVKNKKLAAQQQEQKKNDVYHSHKTTKMSHQQADTVKKPPPLKIKQNGSPVQMSQEEERAVIHAFALAALIGDGSPTRVARARALVETLKDLPGGNSPSTPMTSTPYRSPRLFMGPTLDELETNLRDAMARVALEETWSVTDEGTEQARLAVTKLSAMVEAHPGFAARTAAAEAKWDDEERSANQAALAALRELIPANVAQSDKPSVAMHLAKAVGIDIKDTRLEPLLERIWTQRILWLVHAKKETIAKIHLADLRSRYNYADLDPIELRAIYACLPDDFEHDDYGQKHAWRMALRSKLRDALGDAGGPTAIPHNEANGKSYYGSALARRAFLPSSAPAAIAAPTKVYHHHNRSGTRIGHSAYDVLDHASQPETSKEATPKNSSTAQDKELEFSEDEDNDAKETDCHSEHNHDDEHLEWRECWDDNYKRMYYFNDTTGDSRWEPPENVPYLKFDEHFPDDTSIAPSEAPSVNDLKDTTTQRRFSGGFRRTSTASAASRSSIDGALPNNEIMSPLDAIQEKRSTFSQQQRNHDLIEERPSLLVSPLSDEDGD